MRQQLLCKSKQWKWKLQMFKGVESYYNLCRAKPPGMRNFSSVIMLLLLRRCCFQYVWRDVWVSQQTVLGSSGLLVCRQVCRPSAETSTPTVGASRWSRGSSRRIIWRASICSLKGLTAPKQKSCESSDCSFSPTSKQLSSGMFLFPAAAPRISESSLLGISSSQITRIYKAKNMLNKNNSA